MTFADYQRKIEERNPELFAAEFIKIKPDALIEQLRLAYEAGTGHVTGEQMFRALFGKDRP